MEKRVCIKFTRLPNVVGRVDYISNPKRQENLLGFYQTPADPEYFWKALSEESQELATYNKAQMEEHNRLENERFAAGIIKRRNILKTVEAREMMICIPNDIQGKVDPQDLAKSIAEDIKARHGVECAVGVHLNKTRTNFHAHVILPERVELEQFKESIATRNTYFNAEGKRSTKKECIDEKGNLLPGCKLIKKGELLHQRRFSEKNPLFANKGFCYGEKVHYAKEFNNWSSDHWVVYNHYTNPHIRLYNLRREEPEALRAWKERENYKIRLYNASIDSLMDSGELTKEQALDAKQEFYAKRAIYRKNKKEEHEAWVKHYQKNKENYHKYLKYEKNRIRYDSFGRKRSTVELMIILGLSMAGVNVLTKDTELNESLLVIPRKNIKIQTDIKLQQMIDEVYIAMDKTPPSQRIREKGILRSADIAFEDQIAQAEEIKRKQTEAHKGRTPSFIHKDGEELQ